MNRSVLTDARVPLIVAVLAITGIVLSIHSTGRMYPWALLVMFIGLSVLAMLAISGGPFKSVLVGGVGIGVSYRLALNYFTTPIGSSPQFQPQRMDRIVETGSAVPAGPGFYGDAPFHFLLGALSASVIDTSAYESILLYSILIGVLLPLIVVSLCRYIGIRDRRALLLAALLVVCTTEAIRRSYWVVPQTLGSIFWWLAVMALAKHVTNRDPRVYGCIAIFALAAVMTHRLPPTVLMGVVGLLVVLVLTDKLTWDDIGQLTPIRQLLLLTTFIGSLTLIQWIYVGPLLPTIVARAGRVFTESGATRSGSGSGIQSPEGAVEALPGITAYFIEYPSVLSLFVERGHGIWLVLAAGFGWLYLFVSERSHRPPVQVVLAAAAVCVALLPIGFLSIGALNPTRVIVLVEPVLVVLIIGVLWRLYDTGPWFVSAGNRLRRGVTSVKPAADNGSKRGVRLGQALICLLFVLLLATQIFAASAAPDYANSPRYYADQPEAQAEATLCDFAVDDVYIDAYYGRFVTAERESCGRTTGFDRSIESPLFNKNISPETHQMIAYRTDVDIYLGNGGYRWRLTWDPETSLSKEYNMIYDNDAVVTFRAPQSKLHEESVTEPV